MDNNVRQPVMELILLIANMAHVELHIAETITLNIHKEDELHDQLSFLRYQLKRARILRRELMNDLVKLRPATRGVWCVVKHLVLAFVHSLELLDEFEEDVDSNVQMLDYAKVAQMINAQLDSFLSHRELYTLTPCPRCEDDAKS